MGINKRPLKSLVSLSNGLFISPIVVCSAYTATIVSLNDFRRKACVYGSRFAMLAELTQQVRPKPSVPWSSTVNDMFILCCSIFILLKTAAKLYTFSQTAKYSKKTFFCCGMNASALQQTLLFSEFFNLIFKQNVYINFCSSANYQQIKFDLLFC